VPVAEEDTATTQERYDIDHEFDEIFYLPENEFSAQEVVVNTDTPTGHIKYRYAIRMSAENHLLFHLLPDHMPDQMHGFHYRQPLDFPQLEATAGKLHRVPCLPCQIHNM
jgi:hypothetical protein